MEKLFQYLLKEYCLMVKSEITVTLLEKAMRKQGWENGKFVIDGFPRNHENYNSWLKECGETVNIPFLLFFECSFVFLP